MRQRLSVYRHRPSLVNYLFIYLFIYLFGREEDLPSQAVRVSFQPDMVHSIVLTRIISGYLCPAKQPNVIRDPNEPGDPDVELGVALTTVTGVGQATANTTT